MKKNNFFKILALTILVIALLTWLIPAGYYQGEFVDSGINRLGFVDFCQYLILPFFQSMFLEVLMFILCVGALYGVLSKTGSYKALIEKLAKKFKAKGELTLIIVAFVIAALSSVGGYGLLLFIFIPAIISIILLMGYDRVTALLVTFGAMAVGMIGATYGSNYISQSLLALGLDYNAQILYKVILFVLSLVILVLFTLKVSKTKEKNSDFKDAYLSDESSKKSSVMVWVAFASLFVLLVLGCTNWSDAFGIEVFTKFHTWLIGLTVGNFPIVSSILGNGVNPLGAWSHFEMSIIVLIVAFVVAKVYKVKFVPAIKDGTKALVKAALLVVFAYGVLIIVVNTGVLVTLMSYIFSAVTKFKYLGFLASILINIVGSFTHVELPYAANFYLPYLVSAYSDANVTAVLNVMTQSIFGLTMFAAPTSLFLILGLTYLEVPYVEWLKKTWKLVVALFLLILVILVIMLLVL